MPSSPSIVTERLISDRLLIAWIMGYDDWTREHQRFNALCFIQTRENVWIDALETSGLHEVVVSHARIPVDPAVLAEMQAAGDVRQSHIHTSNPGLTWRVTDQYTAKVRPALADLYARLKDSYNAAGRIPLYRAVEIALQDGTPLLEALEKELEKS